MSSTFNCLPNELIVCIFAYLEPADIYNAFFDLNERSRKLIKQFIVFNSKSLDADILRLSTLHSWYKHLNLAKGTIFYLVPAQAEQPRYGFDLRIQDYCGIHWYFFTALKIPVSNERIQLIVEKYPVKLNPFFYHQSFEYNGKKSYYGADLIHRCNSKKDIDSWLEKYYPKQAVWLKGNGFHSDNEHIVSIFEAEYDRQRKLIRQAAKHVWDDLKQNNINILQIQFG
ncbi:unnamed protein product [Didymodactylos carnosus]|uniref:F-box domain-containing protein n=1 Tax=Didymodactylos carnosus TaxID=1234261 RepID=A0A814ARW2_9BILA|nr:unnamed protein product [Didymodactylos carnosus]CAF0978844.1 unnamed protein product [Didymodactylos carnosus]CAF3697935.1 unnamed protein product [Didymodactylos carnosus]CAF3749466.1 unnamed protein product [Didymodactylos carnosus]